MSKLRVLDLFSGIGGFSLGLERTGGFETVAFCEIEPFPRRALAKHWPEVPCYDDVRTLSAARLDADGIAVDVICGGFPCQDISLAGTGAGINGERSGLWTHYARLVGELRPSFVFVENVAALLGRGLGRILGDLATLGYDAEWHCIPASALGAPHRRDRIWIVAYASHLHDRLCVSGEGSRQKPKSGCSGVPPNLADALRVGREPGRIHIAQYDGTEPCPGGQELADASVPRLPSSEQATLFGSRWRDERRAIAERSGWSTEPDVGRVAHGVPARVDRLRALGNAVVPQIPELIGRAILASLERAV